MSQFSEKCKELIEKNDTNVYRMSKAFDLDWTTLQRMKRECRKRCVNS